MRERQGGRPGVGCVLLTGLVLLGAGVFTALVVAAGQSGILRSDPQGMFLLAALAALAGLVLMFVSVGLRRGPRS